MPSILRIVFLTAALLSSLQLHAQILIGQTAGYTGTVAAGVKETSEGAMLYFNAVNANGGVNGQQIQLLTLDDKFDPKIAKENARILIAEKNVVSMFLTRGTPHTEAIIDVLNEYDVPLVGPSTGAMVLHQPVKKHVFNVRSTYQLEAEKVVATLNSWDLKRIAIIQTDDSFGADGAIGVQKGLATFKFDAVVNEKFDREKQDFGLIARKVAASNAQAVILIASGTAVVKAAAALHAAGSGARIVTLSNNASLGFIKNLGPKARGMIVMQVFPSERNTKIAMVKEAQDLLAAQGGAALSPAMLEGFAAAKVMVEALRRAGADPTRAKVQAALENMKKFDLGGLTINYSPDDHTGLAFSELSVVDANMQFKR
jgi:branched-chain amino acid transport system substrate-binding protein